MFSNKTVVRFHALTLLFWLSVLTTTSAQTTAFTYQGRLNLNGTPASGNYDFVFSLFNDPAAGAQQGNSLTNSAVAVSNGLFTTTIDFGNAPFSGQALWLQIHTRSNGVASFSALSPRQAIMPAPYAIMAASASNLSGGTYSGAVSFTNSGNSFNGTFTGDGSQLTNVPGAVAWQSAGSSQQAGLNVGYLATNDSQQTVITLPVSPAVGAVVRVAGIGAGGWRISQNAGQSILAGNFQFSQSSGSLWTPVYNGSGGYTTITISSDGRNVAALNGSRTIFSGDSGITWTANTTGGGSSAMAASADGTKLVSVAGSIFTSPDGGKTWNSTSVNGISGWRTVASSADGNKLFAAVNGTPFPIYYSTDAGHTFATNNMGSRSWSFIACSADGTRIAAINSSDSRIYYSTDTGNTFTYTTNLSGFSGVALYPDGSRIVAFNGGGTIWVFQNGVSSSPVTHSVGVGVSHLALSADGSRMVAGGSGPLYMSKDFGVTWTQTSSPSGSWTGLASSADGSRWVATMGTQIFISQPATTAGTSGYLVGAQGSAVELQYLGNNQFLPLSSQGALSAF